MREATGNALLTMMMTSIIAIIMIFFVGSLSYSKAYRLKNYIINEIEENKTWNKSLSDNLDSYFKEVGYSVKRNNSTCPTLDNNNCDSRNLYEGGYEACIYRCGNGTNEYYKVITFMKFDFPVIGSALKFKVQGETKPFNDFN